MSLKLRPMLLAAGFALIGLSFSSLPGVQLFHIIDGEIHESPLPEDVYAAAQASRSPIESYLVVFGTELPGEPLIWIAAVVLLCGLIGYRVGLRIERYRADRRARR